MILCGDAKFVDEFMFLADDLDMTDPDEYVYLHTMHNAVEARRLPPHGRKSRASLVRAFRPVLKVS